MKPYEQQNYYELLEVPVSAPPEEIRAAYSRLMELYAPDSIAVYALVDPEQVDTLRARMTEAMEILTDEDLRAEYDKELGVPGQRMVEAATAAGSPPAGAALEQRAVVRAAEALATAAEALANAAAESDTAGARSPEPVAGARPEEGTAQEAPEEEAPEKAPVGADDFRTAFFRGFSFAYVTSSLQSTGLVGSAVYVPPSTGQPEPAAPSAPAQAAGSPRAEAAEPVSEVAAHASPSPASEPAAVARTTPSHAGESAEALARAAESRTEEPVPAPAHATPSRSSASAEAARHSSDAAEAPVHAAESLTSEALVHAAESVSAEPLAPGPAVQPPAPARAGRTPAATPTSRSMPPPLPPGRAGTARPAGEAQPAPETGRQAQRPSSARQLGEAQVIAQDSAIATAESALAQVAARVREPQPPPAQQQRPRTPDIPSDAEFNGELLRRVREARGYSLQQVADRTRISSRHLENVEADRDALPAPVYLRGILMNLARELGLDPLRVSRSYLALASEKAKK